MSIDPKLEGNLNEFYDQASKDIGSLIAGAAVGSAVIFNRTSQPVTFSVYNYVDTVYWVTAQQVLVAPGKHGTVAASGVYFKVHPNGDKAAEFLVQPNKAYVYGGPGDVAQVNQN